MGRSTTRITSPIIGPRTLEQLEDALKALSITLTPGDLATHRRDHPAGRWRLPRLTKPTTARRCIAGNSHAR